MPVRRKFDEDAIALMKSQRASGTTLQEIADEFNTSLTVIKRMFSTKPKKSHASKLACEGKEQSYRENLMWALNAAGEYSRTHKHPATCPNNSSWFLYRQALDEPKDFMSKVNQIESKITPDDGKEDVKKASRKTLGDIEAFLEGFKERRNCETQKETVIRATGG